MFRMSYDQKVVENVEEHFSVCTQMYAYMTHAYAGSLYTYVSMFFSLYGRMIQPAYACEASTYVDMGPRMHTSTQKPYFDYFNSF